MTQDKKTLQDPKSPTDSSEPANQQNESAIVSDQVYFTADTSILVADFCIFMFVLFTVAVF